MRAGNKGNKENAGPLVSVVIPAYNVMPYLARCLESVQGQTYTNLEIILVDDGSTDGTGVFCDEAALLDPRVRVLHKENGGVVSAREAGIQLAHGRYLAFVDGDDWVENGMIEAMAGRIGEADMVSAGVYQEQSPEHILERIDRFEPGIYAGSRMDSLYGRMIYDQETGCLQPVTPWIYNKLYDAGKAKAVHGRVRKDLTFAEDSVFLYHYLLECRSIVILDRCYYHYQYREGSAIHRVNEGMLSDINKVYLALADTFRKHPMGSELLYQLQKWVTVRACLAINETMGFDSRVHIPEFVADLSALEGKAVVLYGAGRVGQDTCRQMKEFGYFVVLWADRDYLRYQKQDLPVSAPADIQKCSYDIVWIAMESEKTAGEIRASLTEAGIPEDKIAWKKPLKLY